MGLWQKQLLLAIRLLELTLCLTLLAAGANVAVGVSALSSFTNGSGNNGSNTGIGNSAGSSITVGYQNTFLGATPEVTPASL